MAKVAQVSLKNTVFKIKDGASEFVEVEIGEGNITYTENQTIEYTLNKGLIASTDGGAAREGDDQAMQVSFDVIMRSWISASGEDVTPIEALQNIEGASGWQTSDAEDPCAPFAVDLEIIVDPDCSIGVTDPRSTVTLPIFRWESLSYDLSTGQISCSGTCQATKATHLRDTP